MEKLNNFRKRIFKKFLSSKNFLFQLMKNKKSRFLSIFKQKLDTIPKSRLRRTIMLGLFGLIAILVFGNFIYIAEVKSLDSSLLELILMEMRAQNARREEWNRMLTFKQKIAGYAAMGSSALGSAALSPTKKYRLFYRLNYGLNIVLNAYMLLLDFYRK